MLHQLNGGHISVDDLKKNLEYAALLLETAYMDETRYSSIPSRVRNTQIKCMRKKAGESVVELGCTGLILIITKITNF